VGFLDQIVGSFSNGADENPTVAMMDAAFAHEGLPWRYVNCEVDDLAGAVLGARAMRWRGFNCSIPHKQAVIQHLQALSTTAGICQAVNCVVADGDQWIGHNTDGGGFLHSLRTITEPLGRRILVVGSGGAAHAIAVELALAGADRIDVASRNPTAQQSLCRLIDDTAAGTAGIVDWAEPLSVPDGTSVIVQATPVGMEPRPSETIAVDWSSVGSDVIAADVVVNPPLTTFLQAAIEAGATTLDGTGMLVNQAAENIRLWTGISPDLSVMRQALEATFADESGHH